MKKLFFVLLIFVGCKKQNAEVQKLTDELKVINDNPVEKIQINNKKEVRYKNLIINYHEFSNSNHPLGYVIIEKYSTSTINFFVSIKDDKDYIESIHNSNLIILVNGNDQIILNKVNSNTEAVKLFRTSEAVLSAYFKYGEIFTEENVKEEAKAMEGRKYGLMRVKK